ALILFLKVWKPKEIWTTTRLKGRESGTADTTGVPTSFTKHDSAMVMRAWIPWGILTVFVFAWGLPTVKDFMNGTGKHVEIVEGVKQETKISYGWGPITKLDFPVPGLHELVEKGPPVVTKPSKEKAIFTLNWLSATGTGIFLSAILAGLYMGYSIGGLFRKFWDTIVLVRFSLLTIAAMLSLGFVTKYSGTDATLGLMFAHTGVLYPFFGAMLGWLGVALTGSDTASNVLFGGLQRVTAEQLGLSPELMAAANSSGGVMGKMIDAQSIVVASTATRWYGHEGDILRYVFWHSLVLAALVGGVIMLQAYVWPFTEMVVHSVPPVH
ncbi:MAG: L-lactate permease, partial [Burkholderiales bacterium]|nr:L-lactate permease [Burkholderiales bacterium]